VALEGVFRCHRVHARYVAAQAKVALLRLY
jgi:hypothetical protein